MRFMMMVKSAENAGAPPQELLEAINKLTVEQSQAGKLVAAGGLAPTAMSSRAHAAAPSTVRRWRSANSSLAAMRSATALAAITC